MYACHSRSHSLHFDWLIVKNEEHCGDVSPPGKCIIGNKRKVCDHLVSRLQDKRPDEGVDQYGFHREIHANYNDYTLIQVVTYHDIDTIVAAYDHGAGHA